LLRVKASGALKLGLREEKKQQTRKAISDMATMLFIERGYHEVTTAEIARRAEVSVPTLFNYFPTKESLVFDEDSEMENELVNTVLNRKKNQSILDALLEAGLKNIDSHKEHRKLVKTFMTLIEETPELSLYAKQMWLRHEKTLARAIQKEVKSKISALEAEAIARFVLDSVHRTLGEAHPKASLRALFAILKQGWDY
jgi:AcrR family transcriptional regulator